MLNICKTYEIFDCFKGDYHYYNQSNKTQLLLLCKQKTNLNLPINQTVNLYDIFYGYLLTLYLLHEYKSG